MRRRTLLIVLVFISLPACTKHPANTAVAPQPSPSTSPPNLALSGPSPIIGKPYPGTGVVKIINRKEGWIEIDHEEIVGLMPAMEMEFWVEKRSLLDNVKVGQKVNFTVVETGRGQILTTLVKAPEAK